MVIYSCNHFMQRALNSSFISAGWSSQRIIIATILGLFWLVAMHLPWPNSGDYGMNLPMNLLAWATICLLSLCIWLRTDMRRIRLTPMFLLLLCSAVLFTLPALWAPPEGLPVALPRLVGIWGGVLAYLMLLQNPLREKETVALFYLLAAAAVVECAISLLGIYYPVILPFPLDSLAQRYSGHAPGQCGGLFSGDGSGSAVSSTGR
ncbi:hypothetical protein [Enterobacter sp.]|uniref:hypothetical protein n=1 Tax=Enterobacter sp. TaxID=42895 RepID=UPI00296FEB18|nr:hypothetical protein [Enterobacter sp.]